MRAISCAVSVGNVCFQGFTKTEAEDFAWTVVKKFGRSRSLRIARSNVSPHIEEIEFEILVEGLPIYNFTPSYGYFMYVNPVTKRVLYFLERDRVPLITKPPAKVTPEEAKKLIAREAETCPEFLRQQETKSGLGPPFFTLEEPEPGYYRRPKEWMARKVWKVTVKVQRQSLNFIYTPSTISWVVDAITGQVFPLLSQDGARK